MKKTQTIESFYELINLKKEDFFSIPEESPPIDEEKTKTKTTCEYKTFVTEKNYQ